VGVGGGGGVWARARARAGVCGCGWVCVWCGVVWCVCVRARTLMFLRVFACVHVHVNLEPHAVGLE
jgi:hypothetical protein